MAMDDNFITDEQLRLLAARDRAMTELYERERTDMPESVLKWMEQTGRIPTIQELRLRIKDLAIE